MKPEPYRIKMTERINLIPREERLKRLEKASYNIFSIPAEDVFIDLLTDSGTGSMSDRQWSALMMGDESYACARSWFRLKSAVEELTGIPYIVPVHQGRAAEHILFSQILKGGNVVPSNSHFDTTRANVEFFKAEGVDCVVKNENDTDYDPDFKGNICSKTLLDVFEKDKNNIPLCMVTITNNSGGGQPVSMNNLKIISNLCHDNNIPLFFDAARFAENSYFIKLREEGYKSKSVKEIAKESFSLADGFTMSAKKDGLVNMGGLIGCRDESLFEKIKERLILQEGFPTYGGLAGRDLEAMASGLEEVTNMDYLSSRIGQVSYLHKLLDESGIPLLSPAGGHAVYVDAKRFFSHVKPEYLPGVSLTVALYAEGGIRASEIGTLMFGREDNNGNLIPVENDLVRLAIPRRVYTESHLRYVADIINRIKDNKNIYSGMKIIECKKSLRHFTARLNPIHPIT